jgi:hypothetical protein
MSSNNISPIPAGSEYRRIVNLTKKDVDLKTAKKFVEKFINPNSKMTFRDVQALSLYEMSLAGGLIGAIGVGGGKTLITLLASSVIRCRRPVVIMPASLKKKTENEIEVYRRDFKIPFNITFISYEKIGHISEPDILGDIKPDLIICDECHKLKNPKSAVTRRIHRYVTESKCKFVAVSGTITRDSIKDFYHLCYYALDDKSPLPRDYHTIEIWSQYTDAKSEKSNEAAKKFVADRLETTLGFISYQDLKADCQSTIILEKRDAKHDKTQIEYLKKLLEKWETPSGFPLIDPLSVHRVKSQIETGFYYEWTPSAPTEWMLKRKEFSTLMREKIGHKNIDSFGQAKEHLFEHGANHEKEVIKEWLEIEPTFKPNPVPYWISSNIIELCLKWLKTNVGIVWTDTTAFALELQKKSGLIYYGKNGEDDNGNIIEDHPHNRSLIACVQSNGIGRNLQKWNKNLIVHLSSSSQINEQLLGRTHRYGQIADEVVFTIINHDNDETINKALNEALYIQQTTKHTQKLLLGSWK